MEKKANLKPPVVFVVVLNWNGKKFLKKCIKSIQGSSMTVDIVVVDNGSSDDSVAYLEKEFNDVHIVKNKKNLGWTGGNNKGVKFALSKGADAILVLNNDTHLSKQTIKLMIDKLYSKQSIGIVGPKIYFDIKGKKVISFAGGKYTSNRYFGIHVGSNEEDSGKYDNNDNTEFVTGAAILIKKEVFKKIGFFDDKYFIYYDEADFCMRARKAGFEIKLALNAHVYHIFSGSVSVGSPFQHYYTTRNHYLFVQRYAPFTVKMREFLRTPKTIFEFLTSQDKIKGRYSLLGIRDYFLGRLGKRVYWKK